MPKFGAALCMKHLSSVVTPTTDESSLYFDDDGVLSVKDEAGSVTTVTTGAERVLCVTAGTSVPGGTPDGTLFVEYTP